MSSLNKVTLIGFIGKDPQTRSTQDGRSIVTFSLATSDLWKDKHSGERKEKTEWHNIAIFNEATGKIVKDYARRGSRIYIEGKITTKEYTDKDNVKRTTTSIIVDNMNGKVILLDKKENSDKEITDIKRINLDEDMSDLDDEIPF